MKIQRGFTLLELMIVMAIVLLLLAVMIPSCAKKTEEVRTEQVKQKAEETASPCLLPKFKVGDTVQTVLRDKEVSEEAHFGQIVQVFQNTNPINGQCQYNVIHYVNGLRIEWKYLELELKPQ